MGLTPRDVDAMSLWEFMAVCDAFNAAHGGKAADALSPDEADELIGLIGQG